MRACAWLDIPSLIRAVFSSEKSVAECFFLAIVRNLCSKLPQMIGKLEGNTNFHFLWEVQFGPNGSRRAPVVLVLLIIFSQHLGVFLAQREEKKGSHETKVSGTQNLLAHRMSNQLLPLLQ